MAGGGDECYTTQLVGGDGTFNVEGLERFLKAVRLAECGLSYAVVSIMGPQSSGKSALLNHLFRTNFREMDAFKGRMQTTKGIWIAKGVGIEPCTIVMDLEGTDGRERGEDDTTFEKQSALFALAISDVVLINMWCHDIGREHAANKPLLKTVFQVMMRLFSPRKTTLLFVIRDKTKTPLELLEPVLREDIRKIWSTVSKPQIHKETPLSEFFNVEVTALPSLEEKEELFREKVAELRRRFINSIAPGGLAGDRHGVIPASGFSFSAQQIWKVIQENKDLDLPSHKVMVATVRCEEIADEKFHLLSSDKDWLDLSEAVQIGPVSSFGKRIGSIIDSYLSGYDMETIYFDDGVRIEKRKQLESRALQLVYPAFQAMLGHLRSKALDKFKQDLEKSIKSGAHFAKSVRRCTGTSVLEFDTKCKDVVIKHSDWDVSKVREKLRRDIEAHSLSVRNVKLSQLKADYEKQVTEALTEPLQSLFDAAGDDTWTSIRNLYAHVEENALSGFSSALSCFELSQETYNKMLTDLNDYVRSVVERKAREEAGKVLMHMKDRFLMVFSHDKDSMPRLWTGKEDIRMITKDARAAGLKVLSALTAIRLDNRSDKIESILSSALRSVPVPQNQSTKVSSDPLASSTWEGVSLNDTLITPMECKSIWRQFLVETEYSVAQAISAQEAHRRSNSWLPPPWAIVAIAVLGFNEFMILLRKPLYLFILFILFLLSRAVYLELDSTGELRNGTLSGLLLLTSRLLTTIMSLLRRLTNDGRGPNQSPAQRPQTRLAVPSLMKSEGGPASSQLVVDAPSSTSSSGNSRTAQGAMVDSHSEESSA